jgi:hypothetical protein
MPAPVFNRQNNMIYQETIRWRGAPILKDAIRIEDKAFIISGRLIKTASLKEEWFQDIQDPEEVIQVLRSSPARIDLLRFWQRIPESEAHYNYYKEWRDVAAIPVTNYDYWWEKQISSKTRNMVRKSQKAGVEIHEYELTDELVRGIVDVFNQSPVRRGKRFWHYGKNFETVKREMSLDLSKSIFIAAYHNSELIGFVKLLVADRYAMITMIIDNVTHRDKSPMNGMIAKAVEICAKRNIPFLTYTVWRRGDHGDFQKRSGFEKIRVPEYYVPLTAMGYLALRLGAHKGVRGLVPEKLYTRLLAIRAWYYARRYSH